MWSVFEYREFVQTQTLYNCILISLHTHLGHLMIESEWLNVLCVVHIGCILNVDIYFRMK